MDEQPGFSSVYSRAPDGLRLHARDYGSRDWSLLPVVCLAGLTRNAVDFHELALALSTDRQKPRRVVALDYRGRGLSEWDPDWTHYDLPVEMSDVGAQLAALGIAQAAFVGTSRGGMVTMGLAAMRPGAIRAVVLNDIGPVLDLPGLLRIRAYVGKLPLPADWGQAVAILKSVSGAQFDCVDEEDWLALAKGSWREVEGRLVQAYDPGLMKPLEHIDLTAPMPDLWPLFDSLKTVPTLAIRGGNSDLLSRETLAAMAARHPGLATLEVPGQGHAPLLRDAPTIAAIAAFVAAADPA
jgi:pimeloyl-ACP methyl ester carboxylesterase